MKTSFKRSWQLLIILHSIKTNTLRVHRKIGLVLKLWKKINERDKVFNKFKKSRLHADEDNYEEERNEVHKLIRKKAYFESKLTQNIGKSKELWKSLKSLGLKIERSISNVNCLEMMNPLFFMLKI